MVQSCMQNRSNTNYLPTNKNFNFQLWFNHACKIDQILTLLIQQLMDWHRPRVKALLEAGVDILALETIPAQVLLNFG